MAHMIKHINLLYQLSVLIVLVSLTSVHVGHSQNRTPNTIEEIIWSPNGDLIATGHTNGNIKIWNTNTNQLLNTLIGHTDIVLSLSWRNDGEQIISGSWDSTVRVWNATNGQLLSTISGFTGTVSWVGWTPDRSKILVFTYTQSKNLHIYDASSYKLISELEGGSIAQVAWSPNMTQLAVAHAGGYTGVWNASTFEPIYYSPEAYNLEDSFGVYVVDWSPNGNLVANGSSDGWVRIWNPQLNQNIFELRGTDSSIDDWTISEIKLVFFSANGSFLSSISADGTLRTWDANTGVIIETLQLSNVPIYAASISPDGARIAYGGESGIFATIPAPQAQNACTPTQTASTSAELINAINTANANPDADVIGLEAGTYTFTTTCIPLNALPAITSEIAILGNGATLTRQAGSPLFGFFEVSAGGSLTLENLTLSGGDVGNDTGGALVNEGGTVTLNNVTFSNNH